MSRLNIRSALVAVWLVAILAPSQAKMKPVTIPNVYQTVEAPPQDRRVSGCAAFGELEIVDARADTSQIGEIFDEDDPSDRAFIVQEGTLKEWLETAALRALHLAAIPAGGADAPTLSITIRDFRVETKVAFNAEFRSTVVVDVALHKEGADKACWQSRRNGLADNYGRPRKAANYVEVMSQSVDRLLFSLAADEGFLKALCECR